MHSYIQKKKIIKFLSNYNHHLQSLLEYDLVGLWEAIVNSPLFEPQNIEDKQTIFIMNAL